MARDQGPFKLDNPWSRIGWGPLGVDRRFVILGSSCSGDFRRTVPARYLGRDLPRDRSHRRQRTSRRAATAVAHADAHRLDERYADASLRPRTTWRIRRAQLHRLSWRARRQPVHPHPHPCWNGFGGDLQTARRLSLAQAPVGGHGRDRRGPDRSGLGRRRSLFRPSPRWVLAGRGETAPENGRSLRQRDPTIRLVFAGDPGRGIPPCAGCHGPGAHKRGAPALRGQHTAYIERQLAAFAQGTRKNDINEQMRAIARS